MGLCLPRERLPLLRLLVGDPLLAEAELHVLPPLGNQDRPAVLLLLLMS